jgi:hypothetical protein
MDIGFPGTEIPALDRVIKQTVDAVTVIGVIFGGIDAALGSDGVSAARGVLKAESFDIISQLGQCRRRRSAAEAGTDHDDVELAFIGGIDQFEFKAMPIPFFRYRSSGDLSVEQHEFSFLCTNRNKDWQCAESDADHQSEYQTGHSNRRHVFGVIGPKRLEGTPKTVADMNRCNDHSCNV